MALVSIVTLAFNAARFVTETIASVRAQTHADWEMLVVDDCSCDDTAATVESVAAIDARVRLIRHTSNGGPARARQTAIDAAGGRYIAFLDSDDLWLPEKLERQLAFQTERRAALTFTEFRRIDADAAKTGRLIRVPDQLRYQDLLCNTAIATSTVIVDRELAGPLRMAQTYYDDFALWLDILRRGFVAHGLAADLMRYRVLGKSVSRNKVRSARMVWRVYRDVERLSTSAAAWCFARYAVNATLKYRAF